MTYFVIYVASANLFFKHSFIWELEALKYKCPFIHCL